MTIRRDSSRLFKRGRSTNKYQRSNYNLKNCSSDFIELSCSCRKMAVKERLTYVKILIASKLPTLAVFAIYGPIYYEMNIRELIFMAALIS